MIEQNLPPDDCRRIIVVGAGGFGREVAEWARQAWPDHADRLAGMVSEDPDALRCKQCHLPIIGRPSDFEPQAGDFFVLGIGIPRIRRAVTERLLARGARFLTLIHPSAIVMPSAVVGIGSVVCPQVIVSADTTLGRFSLLNYCASLGHDAAVGAFSVLSPYATLGGAASVDEDVFLALHATVGPRVKVGARSSIAANSCALANVPADSLVYGVPGRVVPRISAEP